MAELWDIYDADRKPTGKTIERGQPLPDGCYHIAVQVWIRNRDGEWLISRRAPNKKHPLEWEPTGGSAIAGEDSFTAALREVREELGIVLDPSRGRLWSSHRNERPDWFNPGFLDVWLFDADVELSDVVLCPDETVEAMYASAERIREMMESGEFVPFSHPLPPFCGE